MKFWNKDKHLRDERWTKIDSPFFNWPFPKTNHLVITESGAKKMCQLMRSNGKFYFDAHYWYFQRAADATMFLLKLK